MTNNESTEIIKSARTKIIEALEQLKSFDDEHAGFYEILQDRQNEIVRDLEAMITDEEKEKPD